MSLTVNVALLAIFAPVPRVIFNVLPLNVATALVPNEPALKVTDSNSVSAISALYVILFVLVESMAISSEVLPLTLIFVPLIPVFVTLAAAVFASISHDTSSDPALVKVTSPLPPSKSLKVLPLASDTLLV